MRRFAVQDLAHIPHHGIGVEIRPVMEFHATAKPKHPARSVSGINRPFARKTGDDNRRLIRRGQIPHGQAIKQRNAGEAIALKTLVGLAVGQRNICRRHADAQRALGLCDGRPQHRQRHQAGCHQEFLQTHCVTLPLSQLGSFGGNSRLILIATLAPRAKARTARQCLNAAKPVPPPSLGLAVRGLHSCPN